MSIDIISHLTPFCAVSTTNIGLQILPSAGYLPNAAPAAAEQLRLDRDPIMKGKNILHLHEPYALDKEQT